MAGTKEGGMKAKEKNLAKDPEYYSKLGRVGGKATSRDIGKPKGFAANPELASRAGKKGGATSSRKGRPNKKPDLLEEAEMGGYEEYR